MKSVCLFPSWEKPDMSSAVTITFQYRMVTVTHLLAVTATSCGICSVYCDLYESSVMQFDTLPSGNERNGRNGQEWTGMEI